MGYFLMLIAVTIAGVAAYFSVYGLAHIFAAAFWSVVIMGGVLEVGKLVATSFLYRYWGQLRFLLKTYLLIAIAGLMLITSAGIFGYLSNAYQQDIIGVKDVAARIELLDAELATLSERERQINEDIGRIGSNYVTARQNLMKQYAPEKDALTKRVADIRSERLELSTKQLEVEAHTGPIIYIAKAFDRDVDTAVMWMILLIIFVFDPLAVALTIGANIALMSNKKARAELAPPRPEDRKRSTASYLDPDILNHAKEQGEARLAETMQRIRHLDEELGRESTTEEQITHIKDDQVYNFPTTTVAAYEYDSLNERLNTALTEITELETERDRLVSLVEQMTTENNEMEDEIDRLIDGIHRKDATIQQLRDAIVELEAQGSLSIEERVELHRRNQIDAKRKQ